MRTLRMPTAAALLALVAIAPALAQSPPATGQAPPPPPPPAVKVGEAAPDFTLPYLVAKSDGGFDARQVSLAEFRGKQNVVVAFFPAAFSPG